MKIVQFFISLIFLIFIGGVLILSYLGFVPYLSNAMGAGKIKDLGVKYDHENYQIFVNKAKTEIIEMKKTVSPKDSIIYDGTLTLNESFSQEEISARLNYSKWKYMPFGNTQLRINNDGTLEFSANLLVERLPGFIARENINQNTINDVFKNFDFIYKLKKNPPVYIKFTADVTNNNLNVYVQKIEIGKFNVPLIKLGSNEIVESIFESIVNKASGFYGKKIIFTKRQMIFQGTIPEKVLVEVAKIN